MNFRSYLILMTLATICAWIAWLVVLHGTDPVRTSGLGFVMFYGTFAIALFGTVTLASVVVRLWRKTDELFSRITLRSVRQAVLLTGLFVSSLILFANGWYRWWTMALLILITVFIELLLMTRPGRA